jgi:hypothetical protein
MAASPSHLQKKKQRSKPGAQVNVGGGQIRGDQAGMTAGRGEQKHRHAGGWVSRGIMAASPSHLDYRQTCTQVNNASHKRQISRHAQEVRRADGHANRQAGGQAGGGVGGRAGRQARARARNVPIGAI